MNDKPRGKYAEQDINYECLVNLNFYIVSTCIYKKGIPFKTRKIIVSIGQFIFTVYSCEM